MADITSLLTVSQVARSLPGRDGRKGLAPSSVTRWITTGTPNRAGQRVRLKATRAGGRWLVNPDDLAAFFAALASAEPATSVMPTKRTESQRQRAAVAAGEFLKAAGA